MRPEVTMVHICLRCELRFERDAEMRDHLSRDHGVDTEAVEPLHYTGRSGRRPGIADGRRVLVVANRTLHSDELPARLHQMAADAPSRFFLLVPADAGAGETPDQARRLAESRLRHLVDRLHDDGIDAEGMIGHPDPFRAVEDILERERFEEIVLSTLPSGLSRWLAADLAGRLERVYQVPVYRIEATV
jgi:GABA permease